MSRLGMESFTLEVRAANGYQLWRSEKLDRSGIMAYPTFGAASLPSPSASWVAAMEYWMLKRAFATVLLLMGPIGCVTQDTVPSRRADGPAYTQPGVGAPARQTDMFGNALRP